MSYDTKQIIKDGSATPLPVPQYYNSTSDTYEVVQGKNGAPNATIANMVPHAASNSPVTTQATLVAATATEAKVGGAALANRTQVGIFNMDTTNMLYYGDATVSATTGFPIPPMTGMSFDVDPRAVAFRVYVVSAAAIKVAFSEVS